MQPEPLNYERPLPPRKRTEIRILGWVMAGAWAVFAMVAGLVWLTTPSRGSDEFILASVYVLALFVAGAVTLVWLVLLSATWFLDRRR